MLESQKKISPDRNLSILLVGITQTDMEIVSDILSFSFECIVSRPLKDLDPLSVATIKADFILIDGDENFDKAIALCQELRAQVFFDSVPMVLLTSSDDVEIRMKAYKAGFDDCIHKPFRPLELVARVEAKLRWVKKAAHAAEVLRCGNLELNKPSFEARINERSIRLTSLEVRLLDYFMSNKSKVLSRQDILSSVWNSTTVLDRTVDSHIVTLRKKLEGSDHRVKTIFGAGYIFEMDQSRLLSDRKDA